MNENGWYKIEGVWFVSRNIWANGMNFVWYWRFNIENKNNILEYEYAIRTE